MLPEAHVVAVRERGVDVGADEFAAGGHAGELRQLRRLRTDASSSMWKGTPSSVVGCDAGGDGGQDAVGRHPRRDRQVHARVQAVEQAADEPEHVHHRGERHDALAAARDAVDHRVALDLVDEVRGVAADDLGGAGRSGAELDDGVGGGGGPAR